MIKLFQTVLSLIITFFIFFILCNSLIQKILCKKIFIPSKDSSWVPDIYEDIYIEYKKNNTSSYFFNDNNYSDENERIHGFYVSNNPDNDTILYFHGTAESISNSKHMYDIAKVIDHNLFMIDYRGFGTSSLTKNGDIVEDSILAYKWLKNKTDKEIIIWGNSLGGHPSIALASKYDCKYLVLGATFSSIGDIGVYNDNIIISFFSKILAAFYEFFPSRNKIKDVKSPILLIHSIKDDTIPYRCSQELFDNIKNNKDNKLLTIDGTHTNPIFNRDDIYEIFEFLNINISEDQVQQINIILEERNKNTRITIIENIE